MFRRNKSKSIIFPAEFSLLIAVDFILSHSLKTRSLVPALLRRFVPRLRAGWCPCTSKGLKRGVGAFVRGRRGSRFCLRNIKSSTEGIAGRLGESPSLPAAFSGPDSARFYLIWLRQNAQGKGSAEGSKKKLDKFSPHLPAVRTVTLQAQREHPARIPQRRPVGADAHPLGWGKHSVRLYAVRTRRGPAPAPPAPKGV